MTDKIIDADEGLARADAAASANAGRLSIVLSLGFCHLLNDMMQSMVPALYPILKDGYRLDFAQIGLITLTFEATASLLQPAIGYWADRRPAAYALPIGMSFTFAGLILLATASSYPMILAAAAMIGVGSSVFHPEASRVARMASGGKYGRAQSLFQLGGNLGSATGPLLAAFVVVPRGQASITWFSIAALVAIAVLTAVGNWYVRNRPSPAARHSGRAVTLSLSRRRITFALAIMLALIFSKTFYWASLGSYYTFYLMAKFEISVQLAQMALFVFLAAYVVGTLAGGWIADKVGYVQVIWFSILGALPFTLALPYAGLTLTVVLSVAVGLIMASSFSAMLVYAQELLPGRVGMVAGLFFGLSFGLGAIGAAALGKLADLTSIETVYVVCSYLPAIGLLAVFLPRTGRERS
ncbi:MAG: MFS transporter [Alphaproteobacteria bacterium]|nr:MFS transporter [Alphaproteobacteria bacterium]